MLEIYLLLVLLSVISTANKRTSVSINTTETTAMVEFSESLLSDETGLNLDCSFTSPARTECSHLSGDEIAVTAAGQIDGMVSQIVGKR